MVPYITQPGIHLFGRVTIHAFGPLIALAVIVGWVMTVVRCRKIGLNPKVINHLLIYVIVAGFVAAHLYSVLAYHPGKILQDPVSLIKFWGGISSFGGIIGGLFGLWLYFRVKGREFGVMDRWRYLDAVAYAFPFALTIGRLGCTLAHDHPGTITTFPLGVSLATHSSRMSIRYFYMAAGRLSELPNMKQLSMMGFHDLGWYEFLFMILIIVPSFLVLGRKPRQPGFFLIAFFLLYVPVRFMLDFLRLADARYAGLTPAQYAGAMVLLVALYFGKRRGFFLKS